MKVLLVVGTLCACLGSLIFGFFSLYEASKVNFENISLKIMNNELKKNATYSNEESFKKDDIIDAFTRKFVDMKLRIVEIKNKMCLLDKTLNQDLDCFKYTDEDYSIMRKGVLDMIEI